MKISNLPGRRIRRGFNLPARILPAVIAMCSLALVMLIWVAVAIQVRVDKQEAIQKAVLSERGLSESFALHVRRVIESADTVAQLVKYQWEHTPEADFDLRHLQEAGLISTDNAMQVTVINAQGYSVQSTVAGNEAVDLGDRAHFLVHKLRTDVGLYIGSPVVGRLSQRWTIQFSRRLNRPDGSFGGVVVVSESPDFLTNGFYNNTAQGEKGMAIALLDSGAVLSRRLGREPASSRGIRGRSYLALQGIDESFVKDPDDGVPRMLAFQHVDGYPVTVAVGLPDSAVLGGTEQKKRLYIGFAAVGSILLLLVALSTLMYIRNLRQTQAALRKLSETDTLTGLPNRHYLMQKLTAIFEDPDTVRKTALLYIDFNNFRRVNDELGHEAGDALLRGVATRLADAIGAEHSLVRLAGDEFVVVVQADAPAGIAAALAAAVIDSFRTAFVLRGNGYMLTVSVGIALRTERTLSAMELISQADRAMYEAKHEGRSSDESRWSVFSDSLQSKIGVEGEELDALQSALIRREFVVEYRPIETAETVGKPPLEASLAWMRPERGRVSSSEFMPLAEKSGLVVLMYEWMIADICQQLSVWFEEGQRDIQIIFRAPTDVVMNGCVGGRLSECVHKYTFDPSAISVELATDIIYQERAALKGKLWTLRQMGVRVLLSVGDDPRVLFPVVRDLNLNGLRFTGALVRAAKLDVNSREILADMIRLCSTLGLSVEIRPVDEPLSGNGPEPVQPEYT